MFFTILWNTDNNSENIVIKSWKTLKLARTYQRVNDETCRGVHRHFNIVQVWKANGHRVNEKIAKKTLDRIMGGNHKRVPNLGQTFWRMIKHYGKELPPPKPWQEKDVNVL